MGKHFLMSRKFNKTCAQDFDLIAIDDVFALQPETGAVWKKCVLYDLGWGGENGYYRIPMPEFKELINIVLTEDDFDDIYGAAAVVLQHYPYELLRICEQAEILGISKSEYRILVRVFDLKHTVNRCPTEGKTFKEISVLYHRWEQVSIFAKQVDPE